MRINEASLGADGSLTFTAEQLMPYISREVGITTLSTRLPVSNGSFGLSASHVGIPGFRQFIIATGYGLRLAETLSAGVGFNGSSVVASGEWNHLWRVGMSGGIQYMVLPTLLLGMHIFNPVTVSNYPEYGETAASMISVGLRYDLYENTSWFLEAERHASGGWRLKTGAELLAADRVTLLAGFHSNPASLSFGSVFSFRKLSLFIGAAYSTIMGVNPALSISYTTSE
jgi:hypothetical protein